MTKSTLTRERLAKIKSWRETYGAGSNVILPAEEAEELARMMLAAMDSEPVAYIPESQLDLLKRGVMIEADLSKVQRFDEIPLYRHAQQPTVAGALADAFIAAIEKEQDRLHEEDYLMDSKDCIDVIREEVQRLNANCITTLTVSPQEVK